MSVLIYRDNKTVGACAATIIAAQILSESICTVGVDYHETLLPVFDSLSAMTENGLLAWNDTKIYQLFEFLPDESGEQRIANLLGKALFSKTDISEKQYVVPFSADRAPEQTAQAFEESILNDGGLDIALVAVRHDGSLLMDQSADCDPASHVETIDGDSFLTAGLNVLMHCKHPIIVAAGKNAAGAVKAMLKGSITETPLAALRLHPGATFILDEEAAELL
ncbi:MAG: 6-phosphogluconolactonase [Clostridia bacterium]|nr:6-phosphogluconolactonase [Clostridia bacterium]